jgi:NlpC/P60 family putative phage cell wall peptidase
VTGEEIAALARGWVGTPYRHQASLPGSGMDCLGLLRALWRAQFGREPLRVPAYRADWRDGTAGAELEAAAKRLLEPVERAGPGDVLLFRMWRALPPKHCGVVVAPGRFVHAQERIGVAEAALSPWWERKVYGVFRFPDQPPP